MWKTGLWTGFSAPWSALKTLVSKLLAEEPGNFFLPRNMTEFVNFTFRMESGIHTVDSRNFVSDTWTAILDEFIGSFELLLESTTWHNPQDQIFGDALVKVVEYTNATFKFVLFKNSSAYRYSGDETTKVATLSTDDWAKIVKLVNSGESFYGYDQGPIHGNSSLLKVVYSAPLSHSIHFADAPAKLVGAVTNLRKMLDGFLWEEEGHQLIGDRGQAAAIACAVVFGVLTLALIAVGVWRYSHKQKKVLSSEKSIDHAISLYDEQYENEDELMFADD